MKVKENQIPYTCQFSSGSIPRFDIRNCPLLLKKNGLGKEVINDKKYKHKTYSSNGKASELGIQTMAVFPLIHEQDVQYLLSLYFKNETDLNQSLLKRTNNYLDKGFNLIQKIITFQNSKKQYSQLLALKTGIDSVVRNSDKKELLHYIAWNTLNLLATDIVMIYEYIDTDNAQEVFPCEPDIAGKLKQEKQIFEQKLDELIKTPPEQLDELIKTPPEQLDELIKTPPERDNDESSPRYLNKVLIDLNPISQNLSFLNPNDEDIKSTYAIVLRSKYRKTHVEEVMVINYRRHYEFSKNEKQFIEELANIAAIAIYDQQQLI